jgi:hypothetical protein
LCKQCHSAAHSGSLINLLELIQRFNERKNDITRVMCFEKSGIFLGNYSVEEAAKKFSAKEKGIIKCCNRKVKSSKGFIWRFAREGQRIETFAKVKAPIGVKGYIHFTFGRFISSNLLTPWEIKFLTSVLQRTKLTMAHKIKIVKIVNRLENIKN